MNINQMELISEFYRYEVGRAGYVKIYRDKWGKFYVRSNRRWTQVRLNAKEIVRYLSNAANR